MQLPRVSREDRKGENVLADGREGLLHGLFPVVRRFSLGSHTNPLKIPSLDERLSHCIGDEEVCERPAAEDAFKSAAVISRRPAKRVRISLLSEPYKDVLLVEAKGKYAVSGVVPVDDDLGMSNQGSKLDHGERRNAGRVLN